MKKSLVVYQDLKLKQDDNILFYHFKQVDETPHFLCISLQFFICLPGPTLPLTSPMPNLTQTCIPKIQAILIAQRIPSKQRDATSVSSQFCKPTL